MCFDFFVIIPIFAFPFSLTTPFSLVCFHNVLMQLLSHTILLLLVRASDFLLNRNTSVPHGMGKDVEYIDLY
jgi:hypothetical protein